MKIAILTQYFPPETGAPQNRLYSLATNLSDLGAEITVLTAMPNYPIGEVHEGYKGKIIIREKDGEINIIRSTIYASHSKHILPRLVNYFSFVLSSLITGLISIKRHDIIICESPPLFLGITALLLKWIKRSKLVFNVSDLWPESAEKLGIIKNKSMLDLSYRIESLIYKNANLVSGQTQGIIDNINIRFPKVKTYLLRNGIDINQFARTGNRDAFRKKHNIPENSFTLAYAGIIGHAQGLEIILNSAKKLQHEQNLFFIIVGDGPVKYELVALAKEMKLSNLIFVHSVPRNEMPDVIAACDAYISPLKKNDLFLGAIPSKIFEPLYYGKPVLLGVDGEAKNLFVDQGKCALHFEPENTAELSKQILRLKNNIELYSQLSSNGRTYVVQHFNRRDLAFQFWQSLQNI